MSTSLALSVLWRASLCANLVALTSCAALQHPRHRGPEQEFLLRRDGSSAWPKGHAAMQGFFGASVYDRVERIGGAGPGIESSDDQFPVLGGGAQWKAGGDRIDVGFEGLFALSGRENLSAREIGTGFPLDLDVDVLLIEVFGGPFVSTFLGERFRVYAAGGPQLAWVEYDQNGASLEDGGSGFGTGLYARTGLEYVVRPGLLVGIGVRWTDWTLDLGSDLGDLELEGVQYVLTVTTGI